MIRTGLLLFGVVEVENQKPSKKTAGFAQNEVSMMQHVTNNVKPNKKFLARQTLTYAILRFYMSTNRQRLMLCKRKFKAESMSLCNFVLHCCSRGSPTLCPIRRMHIPNTYLGTLFLPPSERVALRHVGISIHSVAARIFSAFTLFSFYAVDFRTSFRTRIEVCDTEGTHRAKICHAMCFAA